MSDIFREVDEDLKQERLQNLWKKYGSYLIGSIVGVILCVSGYTYFDYTQTQKLKSEQLAFEKAIFESQNIETDQALAKLEAFEKEADKNYQILTYFYKAHYLQKKKDNAQAFKVYSDIYSHKSADQSFKHLALIFGGQLLTKIEAASDKKDIILGLENLSKGNSRWKYLALELLALENIKQGNNEKARQFVTQLIEDANSPHSSKMRAKEIKHLLSKNS